jgi:iron complex transport system ATP-binding protein
MRLLIAEGRTVAAGPARETVTTDNVTAAFAHTVEVRYDDGRWIARTKATRIIDV